MIQRRRRPRLAPEPLQRLRVLGQFCGKNLIATWRPRLVLCLINHTHPAAAYLLNNAVVGNRLVDHRPTPQPRLPYGRVCHSRCQKPRACWAMPIGVTGTLLIPASRQSSATRCFARDTYRRNEPSLPYLCHFIPRSRRALRDRRVQRQGRPQTVTPANCVFGRGKSTAGVVVVGDDFTVRGGPPMPPSRRSRRWPKRWQLRSACRSSASSKGPAAAVGETIETRGASNLPGGVGGTDGFLS